MTTESDEEFICERDGRELIGRLKVAEVTPGDCPFKPLTREERQAALKGDATVDLRRAVAGRTLGEWVDEYGWTVRMRPPDGPDREISLEPWRDRKPRTTLVRVWFMLVPRWLYEQRQRRGEDPFKEGQVHWE